MEFRKVWVLRGPNIWARIPVLEAEVNIGDVVVPADRLEAIQSWLTTPMGRVSFPVPPPGSTPAHLIPPVTLRLQELVGSGVTFGLIRAMSAPGLYRVLVAYEEETLGRACLEAARSMILTAVRGDPLDIPAILCELQELAHDVCLGPSTLAIVRAARQRGIPVRRLNENSLVQLGFGASAHRICAAETDRTGVLAETVAQNKELTRSLLRTVGVPVPEGRSVTDAEDAWSAAEDIGLPVVVKPQYGNHGRGVATNLMTRDQVLRAHAAARQESEHILVESFAPGDDYRLLVIGNRLVAAARREPAHVVGNGRSTITELVAEVNRDPRRSDGHSTVLSWIKLDAVSLGVLAEQGYSPGSVPEAGVRVLIRRNGNLSTGGTATDVTDQVHPEVAARAVEAARVVGLDIAGVDVVATDISRPLEEQRAAIVEINAGPGLRMHLEPSAGKSRPVGEAIVDMLFPRGSNGRIPVVAVTGLNGRTSTTRLIAHLLSEAGLYVGMTCSEGTYLNGRLTESRDSSGPHSTRAVLLNSRVEAAVLETGADRILREGLGFDHCDVAVVTSVGTGDPVPDPWHRVSAVTTSEEPTTYSPVRPPRATMTLDEDAGLPETAPVEELARIKRVLVEAVVSTGVAVLNAADPLVAGMAGYCPGEVILFAADERLPFLAAHRFSGGRAVFIRDEQVILAHDGVEETLLSLDRILWANPGTVEFEEDDLLAATAVAWWLGLSLAEIRSGLEAAFLADFRFPILTARS
jgi:cyanophycin synthetase